MNPWLKKVRAFLVEPTLARRSVLTVLLAFVLVWAVLLGLFAAWMFSLFTP